VTKRYICPNTGLDRLLGLQKVEASRISRKNRPISSKVVSPTYWLPLLPEDIPGSYSVRGSVYPRAIVWVPADGVPVCHVTAFVYLNHMSVVIMYSC